MSLFLCVRVLHEYFIWTCDTKIWIICAINWLSVFSNEKQRTVSLKKIPLQTCEVIARSVQSLGAISTAIRLSRPRDWRLSGPRALNSEPSPSGIPLTSRQYVNSGFWGNHNWDPFIQRASISDDRGMKFQFWSHPFNNPPGEVINFILFLNWKKYGAPDNLHWIVSQTKLILDRTLLA